MTGSVAASFAHTPWDGSHPLFRIGLNPLDLHDWIEADEKLEQYLDEKDRLSALYPGKVFMAEANTEAAQQEVLDLLLDYLPERYPAIYRREGGLLHAGTRTIDTGDGRPPLAIAAALVQEDLILMRRSAEGWRLAAASLHFPSAWSLGEKFRKPLQEIHQPVPGFGPGTRNASVIERIFDNLQVEMPVWRMNWSVYSDAELFHDNRLAEHLQRQDRGASRFVRVEYQTLRKLPVSGDLLFTVRIHLDPLEMLERHPDRERLARGFISSLALLDRDQLAYKGLTEGRDRLIDRLEAIAGDADA